MGLWNVSVNNLVVRCVVLIGLLLTLIATRLLVAFR